MRRFSLRTFVRPSVRPSVHPFPPLRPGTWLVVWAWGLADWGTTKMSNFLCLLAKSPISYLTIPAESRPKMSNKMSNFLKRDTIFSFLDIFFLGRSLSILWFLNYWTSDGWLWILIYAMCEIELSHSLLRMIDINLSVKFLDMLLSVRLSIHPSVRPSVCLWVHRSCVSLLPTKMHRCLSQTF